MRAARNGGAFGSTAFFRPGLPTPVPPSRPHLVALSRFGWGDVQRFWGVFEVMGWGGIFFGGLMCSSSLDINVVCCSNIRFVYMVVWIRVLLPKLCYIICVAVRVSRSLSALIFRRLHNYKALNKPVDLVMIGCPFLVQLIN